MSANDPKQTLSARNYCGANCALTPPGPRPHDPAITDDVIEWIANVAGHVAEMPRRPS